MYRAEKRLNGILNRAKKAGLTDNDLKNLKVVQRICREDYVKRSFNLNNKFNYLNNKFFVIVLSAAICITVAYVFYFKEGDSRCFLDMPRFIGNTWFRDPVDCDFCRDITQIDRVFNITPEAFERKYAYSGRPVIVTDGAVGWPALETFNFRFFRDLYIKRDACQFFSYKTEFKSLREALNMSADRAEMVPGHEPWYFGWCSCDDEPTAALREHYRRPYFLPKTSDSVSEDWIFMGTPGPGAHLHVDDVGNPSWQAQIKGKKKWRISPPAECLYECYEFSAVVNPGEIIVLDTDIWYHQTFVVSDDVSITIGSEYD